MDIPVNGQFQVNYNVCGGGWQTEVGCGRKREKNPDTGKMEDFFISPKSVHGSQKEHFQRHINGINPVTKQPELAMVAVDIPVCQDCYHKDFAEVHPTEPKRKLVEYAKM